MICGLLLGATHGLLENLGAQHDKASVDYSMDYSNKSVLWCSTCYMGSATFHVAVFFILAGVFCDHWGSCGPISYSHLCTDGTPCSIWARGYDVVGHLQVGSY